MRQSGAIQSGDFVQSLTAQSQLSRSCRASQFTRYLTTSVFPGCFLGSFSRQKNSHERNSARGPRGALIARSRVRFKRRKRLFPKFRGEIEYSKILLLRPFLRLCKSGLTSGVMLILNTEYMKMSYNFEHFIPHFLAILWLVCSSSRKHAYII